MPAKLIFVTNPILRLCKACCKACSTFKHLKVPKVSIFTSCHGNQISLVPDSNSDSFLGSTQGYCQVLLYIMFELLALLGINWKLLGIYWKCYLVDFHLKVLVSICTTRLGGKYHWQILCSAFAGVNASTLGHCFDSLHLNFWHWASIRMLSCRFSLKSAGQYMHHLPWQLCSDSMLIISWGQC